MIPKSSNYYFLIFIIVGVISLISIPAINKAFSTSSDEYIIHEMNRAQAEMYFYKLNNGNFKYACISSGMSMLISDVLYELGSGLSCSSSYDDIEISLYTTLNSEKIYCVDSSGFQNYIDESIHPMGYCSN